MYQILKKTITSIIPRQLLFQQEEKLRKVYSLFYSGTDFICNVCLKKLNRFSENLQSKFVEDFTHAKH